MLHSHPQALTTPAVRWEIARSQEVSSALAHRYWISYDAVRRWCNFDIMNCYKRNLSKGFAWKASEEGWAIVCHLRKVVEFDLDDLIFVLRHFLPRLNRGSV